MCLDEHATKTLTENPQKNCAGAQSNYTMSMWSMRVSSLSTHHVVALQYNVYVQVPFSGKSMPELKRNVCEGRYAPITANYSSELKQLCMDMLTVDAAKRPTVAALIQRPEIQAKMRALPVIKAEEKHVDMVHTIVVPRELKQMAHVFPEARYDAIPASGA